jgi:hypothetical protein
MNLWTSIGTNTFPKKWFVLLAGLQMEIEELELGPGLVLRHLKKPISVFDLAAAGAKGFREWAVLEPIAGVCACELESDSKSAREHGYDTLNRAWLASALLVLRGYGKHIPVACSAYSWNLIAGRSKVANSRSLPTDLPRFKGGLLEYQLKVLTTPALLNEKLNAKDAGWINSHFETFNRIAAKSTQFRLALEAAVDWRFSKEPRSAVARLWSGIESLFRISSELVYRVSILSACLLEERGKMRKERFKDVKKLYGFRSKVVHGGNISEKKIVESMDGSFRLLCELLQLCIEKGHVLGSRDFEKALFW